MMKRLRHAAGAICVSCFIFAALVNCQTVDGLQLKATIDLPDVKGRIDHLDVDLKTQRVFVAALENNSVEVADLKSTLPLKTHPESFQIDLQANRIYTNLPNEKTVVVFDSKKRQKIAQWPAKGADRNYPMAIDEEHHGLFIGCRTPPRLIVYDTKQGAVKATYPIGGDAEDIFFDAERHRLYVSCGEGVVNVFSEDSLIGIHLLDTVPTEKEFIRATGFSI